MQQQQQPLHMLAIPKFSNHWFRTNYSMFEA
ncbi:Uncharacterised protein [Vibrio cholerae]|nr:Uncharacterised protein [Vibrio cholerae]